MSEVTKEKEIINLKLLTTNPSGAETSFLAPRSHIIEGYEEKFRKLDHSRIEWKFYKTAKGIYTIVHIPSESFKHVKFGYQVIFFFRGLKDISSLTAFDNAELDVYCNNPSFIYSGLAHILHKKNALFLKNYLSPDAYKEEPDIRNPDKIVGFDKTIFYAYLYLRSKDIHRQSPIVTTEDEMTSFFAKNITTFDATMKGYKKAEEQEAKFKRDNKKVLAVKDRVAKEAKPTKMAKDMERFRISKKTRITKTTRKTKTV
jgi:hypothetical protein